jgi:RimJ/RimL family protein N-acetyltransferase
MNFIEPITLSGRHATLEPLSTAHHDALCEVVKDGELWRLWYTSVPSPETMQADIASRLDMRDKGLWFPFVIRRNDTGAICGSTAFLNIDAPNRRVEIGATWYAASAQRTGINTEAKLMLLTHAFEKLDCIAVELRTHHMNQQSRAAIARLGAKQDGILRSHRLVPGVGYRDTVVFSIIESEWPTVRRHLQFKLER